jgi:DNA-binding GntR family transcriptional regulator
MDTLIGQHDAVIDALEAGSSEDATASLRSHLRKVFDDITVIREQNPEYFAQPVGAGRRR